MKACAEFSWQIAENFSLKFPLCIINLESYTDQFQDGVFWSVSEYRVPLFNQLIQLLLA